MAVITVGTNSYVTEAELATYASDRGITISATDTTVLLIKAMDWLETRSFIGTKTVYNQSLQFPRILCGNQYPYETYDNFSQYPQNYYTQCEYDNLTVPNEIKKAQMIAALLIDSGYDLQSVIGQAVKREKVDVIEIEYQDKSNSYQQFVALNDILKPFVNSQIRAVRA